MLGPTNNSTVLEVRVHFEVQLVFLFGLEISPSGFGNALTCLENLMNNLIAATTQICSTVVSAASGYLSVFTESVCSCAAWSNIVQMVCLAICIWCGATFLRSLVVNSNPNKRQRCSPRWSLPGGTWEVRFLPSAPIPVVASMANYVFKRTAGKCFRMNQTSPARGRLTRRYT